MIGHAVCITVCVWELHLGTSEQPQAEVQTSSSVCTKRETDSQHPAPILPLPVIVVSLWELSVIMFVQLIPTIRQHFQFILLLELVILHTGVNEFNCQLRRVNTSIRINAPTWASVHILSAIAAVWDARPALWQVSCLYSPYFHILVFAKIAMQKS